MLEGHFWGPTSRGFGSAESALRKGESSPDEKGRAADDQGTAKRFSSGFGERIGAVGVGHVGGVMNEYAAHASEQRSKEDAADSDTHRSRPRGLFFDDDEAPVFALIHHRVIDGVDEVASVRIQGRFSAIIRHGTDQAAMILRRVVILCVHNILAACAARERERTHQPSADEFFSDKAHGRWWTEKLRTP